jgi:hypothetical protein
MNPTVLTDVIYQLRLDIKRKYANMGLGEKDRHELKDLSEILANLQRAELDYVRGKKC